MVRVNPSPFLSPKSAAPILEAENLLGTWTDSAAFVYCRDLEGRLLAANRAFLRRFGVSPTEIAENPIRSLVHHDDLHLHLKADESLVASPHRTELTTRWLTPQGWHWIQWEESYVNSGDERFVRSIGHDRTRERSAEEQYFKLSRAVEQSPVAILITDAHGHAQYVNAKFTEATGQTLEQLLEREVSILHEGHPNEESCLEMWASIRAGREWRGELRTARPDGSSIWESVQVSCLRNADNVVTNLLCLREDITARKALEDQLRQAQKMESLGTMAGGIAHDFNNIIAVISGFAELASNSIPPEQTALHRSIGKIRHASRRAADLVHQILTFSRKTEVHFAPVDLNQLSRDIIALLGETFPRSISCHLQLDPSLPSLLADQNQLQQIILNLCVNARDAMPDGGSLTLSTSVVGTDRLPSSITSRRPCACLSISDTGTGMTPEIRARIFEPFFSTKPVNQGTGLGLAVVYGIVTAHGGAIEVDSALGEGSTFYIYLPLAETHADAPTATRSIEFPAGHEYILVVDDESSLCELLESTLVHRGYRVRTAFDGLDALKHIRASGPEFDAVLLDVNMPGASGFQVAQEIRACQPNIPIVVMTGHLEGEMRTQLESIGCKHFVMKPYSLGELGRSLRKALDSNHPRNA